MEKKQEQILEKALQLFMKYGLRSVSMDDLCKELAISKKTLYDQIENKRDLIRKVIQHDMDRKKQLIDQSVVHAENAIDVLLILSRLSTEIIQKYNPNFIFDLQKYYPDIYEEFNKIRFSGMYYGIIMNLKRGIKEGLYRKELDVELVAKLYTKKLKDINQDEMFSGNKFSFEHIFKVMFENHIRGIANKKGIEYLEKIKNQL